MARSLYNHFIKVGVLLKINYWVSLQLRGNIPKKAFVFLGIKELQVSSIDTFSL